jgi:hypothetical protein
VQVPPTQYQQACNYRQLGVVGSWVGRGEILN